MRRLVPLLALALALAGCGHSPPTQFYTLDAVPPRQPTASTASATVAVGDVRLPATLDRLSIVMRNGLNRLDVSDQARWVAPLQGMIRRVLADDLRLRLGTQHVLPPGDPMPQGPVNTVVLNVQDFIGSRDGTVTLDADWSVQNRRQTVLMTRRAHLTRHVDGTDIGAIVAAQSEMLGALSDDAARELATAGD